MNNYLLRQDFNGRVKIVSSPDCFFPFLFGDGGKKGLVDLHRLFCSADPQILGIAYRC